MLCSLTKIRERESPKPEGDRYQTAEIERDPERITKILRIGVDPVIGTVITRITKLEPETGAGIVLIIDQGMILMIGTGILTH